LDRSGKSGVGHGCSEMKGSAFASVAIIL
jgi:hypothetical protein